MNARHCKNRACGRSLAGMRSDAEWCSRACAMAAKRARSANAGRTSGPSGLQVAYRRMVDVLADEGAIVVTTRTRADARRKAERIVREALSDRQRARLDARRAA